MNLGGHGSTVLGEFFLQGATQDQCLVDDKLKRPCGL